MKAKILILSALIVCLCSTVFAASFGDLTAEHWAYNYITTLTDEGIINGYPEDNTFRPEATISRAEYLKLVVASSLPKTLNIEDSPSSLEHWVGKYLYLAETYGVVSKGSWTLENIDMPITRMEMALIVAKADMVLKGQKMDSSVEISFNDADQMSAEEIRFLKHTVARGFINGYPEDNTFRPDNNMTRAEAATIIYRYTK